MFICGWLTPAAALRLCRSEELPVSLVVRWNKDCCALNKEIRPALSARKRKMKMDAREELCQKLMDIVDTGYDLMAEYDSRRISTGK